MTYYELHLVEDSPADVELVEEALEAVDESIELTVSHNGEEFTDFLNEGSRPDLVLLDIDLPRKNGFEVLETIKSDEELRLIPIIILTMSNAEEDIRRGYRQYANACVTKPLGFDEFQEQLNNILEFWLHTANKPRQYASKE
ncbi:MAG: response regulator [bacterium]